MFLSISKRTHHHVTGRGKLRVIFLHSEILFYYLDLVCFSYCFKVLTYFCILSIFNHCLYVLSADLAVLVNRFIKRYHCLLFFPKTNIQVTPPNTFPSKNNKLDPSQRWIYQALRGINSIEVQERKVFTWSGLFSAQNESRDIIKKCTEISRISNNITEIYQRCNHT